MNNLPIDDIFVLVFMYVVFLFGVLTFVHWRVEQSKKPKKEHKRSQRNCRSYSPPLDERAREIIKEDRERLLTDKLNDNTEYLEKIIESNKKYNNGGFIPNDDKEPAGVVHKGYTINPNSPLEYPNFEFIYQGMDRLAEYNNKIELQELHTKLRYGIKGE